MYQAGLCNDGKLYKGSFTIWSCFSVNASTMYFKNITRSDTID